MEEENVRIVGFCCSPYTIVQLRWWCDCLKFQHNQPRNCKLRIFNQHNFIQGQSARHIKRRALLIYCCLTYQPSAGAPTGQVPAQAPQSMQASASITYLPSPSEIAFTGQPSAQAPQAMQSSEITYAIIIYLLYVFGCENMELSIY